MLEAETALDSWHEWDVSLDTQPVVIGPMGGGRSNRSFLLNSSGGKMVLRINAPPTVLPNPDRTVEARVWRAASDAGIAPQLLYSDPGGAFLVSTYIENELPAHPQDSPGFAEMALNLLRSCHQLDVVAPAIDYAMHIESYWQRIENGQFIVDPDLLEQREPMRKLLLDLCAGDSPQVLCHHDLVVENFVGTPERLYLVDWEYATLGLAVMDYAALAEEWGIEDDAVCRQAGVVPKMLAQAKSLYRYLCILWEATNTTP